jgi:hypothetical protein
MAWMNARHFGEFPRRRRALLVVLVPLVLPAVGAGRGGVRRAVMNASRAGNLSPGDEWARASR